MLQTTFCHALESDGSAGDSGILSGSGVYRGASGDVDSTYGDSEWTSHVGGGDDGVSLFKGCVFV